MVTKAALKAPHTSIGRVAPKLGLLLIAPIVERGEICAALGRVREFRLDVVELDFGDRIPPNLGSIDAVLAVTDRNHGFPAAIHELQTAKGGRPTRIALLRDRSSATMREALVGGADELLFLPLEPGDSARVLLKLADAQRVGQSAALGRIWSVSSITGGVGVTTVAANCALALAYWGKKKVALLDLDYESSDLATALNLEPDSTIFDLSDSVAELNSLRVEAALSKHPSGVYLLAAPKHLEEGEQVSVAQVSAVLELTREMVDYVVVDTGRHFNETAVTVWEHSAELLYVLDQSVRAMRGAWRFLDLFLRLKLGELEPRFVLNRYSTRHPLTTQQISHTLGRSLLASIPKHEELMELTLGRGEDLWKLARRSKLTASFEQLAGELSNPPALAPKRAGFFSALFRNDKSFRS
jgi:pilus assembly protein CpaE